MMFSFFLKAFIKRDKIMYSNFVLWSKCTKVCTFIQGFEKLNVFIATFEKKKEYTIYKIFDWFIVKPLHFSPVSYISA